MLSLRGFAPVWFINFPVQVVMFVKLVKPADISSHECVSTYFDSFSNVFRHLQSSESCPKHLVLSNILHTGLLPDPGLCSYFKNTKSMFIKWEKPDLNQQVKHPWALPLTGSTLSPLGAPPHRVHLRKPT